LIHAVLGSGVSERGTHSAEERTIPQGPGTFVPKRRCTLPYVDGFAGTVLVAAAVLIEHGRVLLTQRKAGTHLAGLWEFPGGKIEPGEDPRDALRRELREELGIETIVGEIVDVTFHRYEEAKKAVLLLFFEVARVPGSPTPRALEVAAVRWADPADLGSELFPPADRTILAKVRRRLEAERAG
jgi:8-oxo-dGTP diphosphatase